MGSEMTPKEHEYKAAIDLGRPLLAPEIAMVLRTRASLDKMRTMTREELVALFNTTYSEEVEKFGKRLE